MDWLMKLVPTIATCLGGPLAGLAVTAVSKALGIDEDNVLYEDLSDDLIDEIYEIIDQYDVKQNKLHDSCKDENW